LPLGRPAQGARSLNKRICFIVEIAGVLGIAREIGKGPQIACNPDGQRVSMSEILGIVRLERDPRKRSPQPKCGRIARVVEVIGIVGKSADHRQCRRQAIGQLRYRTQAPTTGTGRDLTAAVQSDDVAVLEHNARVERKLPGGHLAATCVDHPGLLAALAMGPEQHNPDHIAPANERHIDEFVSSLNALVLRAAQHFIDVQFDVVPQRELTAQRDTLKHAGLDYPRCRQ